MSAQQFPPGFDEQRVRSHMAEFRANSAALEGARERLLPEHDGQWAISYQGEFLFEASIEAVLDLARRAGWPLDVTSILHLAKTRPTVLL